MGKRAHQVAHISFEIDDNELTFSLVPGEAVHAKDRKPLFSGIITDDMPDELEQLALRLRLLKENKREQKQ